MSRTARYVVIVASTLAAAAVSVAVTASTDSPTPPRPPATTTTSTTGPPITTTTPPTTTASRRFAPPHASRKAVAPRAVGRCGWNCPDWTDDPFDALSACEAGMNPRRVSASGAYRGAFQFSMSTWHGIGESGDPIDYDYAHQKAAARRLQARSGWGQWPTCSRKLGLR